MPVPHLCTVVPDNDVREAIDRWIATCPPFKEAWLALEWLLSHNPYVGLSYRQGNPSARVYKQASFERFGAPDITVVYTLEKDLVEIRSMRVGFGDRDMTGLSAH